VIADIATVAERASCARTIDSWAAARLADESSAIVAVDRLSDGDAHPTRWYLRMRGDEEPVPLSRRDWFREIIAEPDPRRRLALVAHNARLVRERTAALSEIVRQAAPADPQIADLWERFQREHYERGMRRVARTLARDRVLATDARTATDLLWTLTHPDLYLLLVRERGWKPEAYERWLGGALCRELLADSPAR